MVTGIRTSGPSPGCARPLQADLGRQSSFIQSFTYSFIEYGHQPLRAGLWERCSEQDMHLSQGNSLLTMK